jgi:uncharacterized protein
MKALKVPLFTVLLIFICLVVFFKLLGFSFNTNSTKNVFHAQGTGKVTAVPDLAAVTVGVTQDALVAKDAQNKVNETTAKIIAELKKLGFTEKDIKTQNYSVNPKYSYYMPTRNKPDGYTVSQEMEIKSKSIDKINKAIDVATINGANIINGASFTFSDELQKKLENQAREKAVAEAKQKAETLSKAAGMRLGKIIDITENSDRFYPVPMMMKTAAGNGSAGEARDLAIPATQVSPGENSINISVDLTYEVR